MTIFKERIAIIRIRRGTKSFANAPAIVRSGDPVVDFFPGALPNIIDEHAARAGLERKSKGIPQSHRPDRLVGAGGRTRKSLKGRWIIRRNGTIRVNAQDLAQPIG